MNQQYAGGALAGPDLTSIWAESGAAGLSGRADAPPLAVPAALVSTMTGAAAALEETTTALGCPVRVDGAALLGERAALAGLRRRGDTSCGGGTRLLATAAGWIALSLTREDDIDLVPAWLEMPTLPTEIDELWRTIAIEAARRSSSELIERAILLGLAASAVAEVPDDSAPTIRTQRGSAFPLQSLVGVVVVDLSSLWAGPLAAQLLGAAGARVIKVESLSRPDGARLGNRAFYDLLHAGHDSVAFDFADPADLDRLRRLVQRADVVIEASRPRALQRLGIGRPVDDGPRVWLSITGYGSAGDAGHRVGFGDDAAAAGGLITRDPAGPCFCCDAVADPATGLLGALAAVEALAGGGRWDLDLALGRVAASMSAGPLVAIGDECTLAVPRSRPISGVASQSGEHTRSVLREFGIRR